MKMGERIKKLRKERKMSQEELGQHLGVKKTAINKYENGQVENIPRDKIETMARLFDVTPEYILAFNVDEKTGYMTDSKLREYLINKYGSETVRLLDRFSAMTDEGKNKLFALCDLIDKAEKFDQMKEFANK